MGCEFIDVSSLFEVDSIDFLLRENTILLQVPSYTYQRFVQLLQFGCYSRYVLSGLVISIGGLQDSLKRVSLLALLEYLEGVESKVPNTRTSREYMLSVDIMWVLQQYRKCDRVIVPTLKVLPFLCSALLFLIWLTEHSKDLVLYDTFFWEMVCGVGKNHVCKRGAL